MDRFDSLAGGKRGEKKPSMDVSVNSWWRLLIKLERLGWPFSPAARRHLRRHEILSADANAAMHVILTLHTALSATTPLRHSSCLLLCTPENARMCWLLSTIIAKWLTHIQYYNQDLHIV